AMHDGRIKAVWVACTNPAHSMPDANKIRDAFNTAEFVVVQEAFVQTDTVPYADVLLPASSWGEKSGTVTNSERRISRVRQAVPAPGDAKPDWWIVNEVARRMQAKLGKTSPNLFAFEQPEDVFNEHRLLTEGRDLDIGGLSYDLIEHNGPQQWPFISSQGQARRYIDGSFATTDGRARFHAPNYLPVAEPTSARFPFHLLTGRLRDQWHGMSRSGRAASAFAHAPEPSLTMHPSDAERRGLKAGDFVAIASRRTHLVLPLQVSDEVQSGTVFAAMHWNGQYMNCGGINEACSDAVDPKSFQPELKHAAVRIEKTALPWRMLAARRGDVLALQARVQPLLKDCSYAAIGVEQNLMIVRAAHTSAPHEWLEHLQEALDLPVGSDTLEYRDARRGIAKRATWEDGRLAGMMFAGDLSSADAVLDMLRAHEPWSGSRLTVFSNQKSRTPVDRTICNCKQVKASSIDAAIAQGSGFEQLKSQLGCGTVCGSCIPELKQLCAMRNTETNLGAGS
ncbi:MAG: molybdopterin-dependent oxidoreductase, partial [Burkholderiaceae bacterium]|nr:molybdopterin-dependent oxidoreductase [Burkholderiaceae bacterium]